MPLTPPSDETGWCLETVRDWTTDPPVTPTPTGWRASTTATTTGATLTVTLDASIENGDYVLIAVTTEDFAASVTPDKPDDWTGLPPLPSGQTSLWGRVWYSGYDTTVTFTVTSPGSAVLAIAALVGGIDQFNPVVTTRTQSSTGPGTLDTRTVVVPGGVVADMIAFGDVINNPINSALTPDSPLASAGDVTAGFSWLLAGHVGGLTAGTVGPWSWSSLDSGNNGTTLVVLLRRAVAETFAQSGHIAASPDGAFLYYAAFGGGFVFRIHLDTFEVDWRWATLLDTVSSASQQLGVSPDGSLVYAMTGLATGVLYAVDMDGASTVLASNPAGVVWNGFDVDPSGDLWVYGHHSGGHNSAWHVTAGGTVTEVTDLEDLADAYTYVGIAAPPDGSVWVLASDGTNNLARRLDAGVVTDFPLQAYTTGSRNNENGIWWVDADSSVLVPMVSFDLDTDPTGWFVHCTAAGTATLVAGTFASANGGLIVDGILGTSRAADAQIGACRLATADGAWLADNDDAGGDHFLRRLVICATGGWTVGYLPIGG